MILSLEKLRAEYKLYRKKDQHIAERLDILISWTKFELNYSGEARAKQIHAFCTALDLSERTVQRWKKAYSDGGPEGLGKKKASGRPPGELCSETKKKIEEYRKNFRWGSEVIQAHLKYDHHIEITRHKIERFLEYSGLRDLYPCTTKKRQKAQKRKHTKVVKIFNPGEHTQMDVKYQLHLLENKSKCYVYNFVDHASNWSFKYAYSRINERNTFDFMNRLMEVCPFEILRLQTDNGIEFTFKYVSGAPDEPKTHLLEKLCVEYGIKHKLIPPGEKELQGLVERSHRQDDQELFSRISPLDLEEFNKTLNEFVLQRNNGRRFKKLGWKTPNQWLEEYLIAVIAFGLNLNERELKVAQETSLNTVNKFKIAA